MISDGPRNNTELQLCYDLHRLFEQYADQIGVHRTHAMFKGMTAAEGKRLRGQRGKTDPDKYSPEPAAVQRRKYPRSRFERLVTKPMDEL